MRKAIDTVGQVSAAEHARLTKVYRPHIIVIVLDLSGAWQGSDEKSARYYLEEFFAYFGDVFKSNYLVRRKLRAVFILLNKKDRADAKKLQSWQKRTKALAEEKLSQTIGASARGTIVMQASLVEDFDGGQSANAIIQKIALKLQEG